MTLIRFPYKQLRGISQPVIPIGVKIENAWESVNVYMDSGSEYTILHAKIAELVGFNYHTGNRISLQVGDGSLLLIYLHELEMQLVGKRFSCPVGFYPDLGVDFNVLGKIGIFDRFKICFQQAPGLITFES
ncbi:MAG: hypothetical protein GDA48_27445 [Hormoscilla sp. GM102CHS1]|nr:hypothetical protein [Hormoscilla sp. GM102CHS1]